jgi:hypothetical protein
MQGVVNRFVVRYQAVLGHGEPAGTYQRTIHWMSVITQLWMNLN